MVSPKRVKKMSASITPEKITDSFVPDELVLEIVSRLQVKDVFRCRQVCRRWRDLTISQEFLDLQMGRQGIVPSIFVEIDMIGNRFKHFLLDKWWVSSPTIPKLQNNRMYRDYKMQLSDNGLIVFKQFPSCENYIILNPTNGENVKISISSEIKQSNIYGVFFHPSLKEYCTLWIITAPPEKLTQHQHSRQIEFKLLNLGPNPRWRNIKCECQVDQSGIELSTSVFVDNCLYWMVYERQDIEEILSNTSTIKIMEFDVDSEEFRLIPVSVIHSFYIVRRLFNNGGVLSMVEIYPQNMQIVACISILTSRSLQSWTKTRFFFDNICRSMQIHIEPLALTDKQLVFFSDDRVFVCNLEIGTIKKFGRKLSLKAKFLSHVMTLASLKGCKSEFCMGHKGEMKCDAQTCLVSRKQISISNCSVSRDPANNEEGSTSNGKAN